MRPALSAARLAAVLALGCTLPALARDGFYRFPAVRCATVVFTAEGDLWRVPVTGCRAERVTTQSDLEQSPALLADGRLVAFSNANERAGEAYLMPLDGGLPQRLTWDGQTPRVWGLTPAGEVLLTAPTTRDPGTQPFAIDLTTLARRTLPAGQASDGALSPDGRTLFFTRRGLATDNVRAYRGGAMAQLWRLAVADRAEAVPLLPPDGNAQRPMPYVTLQGLRVAFLSDRDGAPVCCGALSCRCRPTRAAARQCSATTTATSTRCVTSPCPAAPQPAKEEIWRFAADGGGSPLQITRDRKSRRLAIMPSPDGQWLAHTDLA